MPHNLLVFLTATLLCFHTLGIGVNGAENNHANWSPLDRVIEWWGNVSSVKPIKCEHDRQDRSWTRIPKVAEPYLNNKVNKRVVHSMPCSEAGNHPGAKRFPFAFKGSIKNDTIDGPGKLDFLALSEKAKAKFEPDELLKDVCFVVNGFSGNNVKSVVGTFANGVLEGPAKLTYEDGSVKIANFKNGFFFGYRRDFGADAELNSVSYYNFRANSMHWYRVKDYIILVDDHFVQEADEEPFAMAVPIDGDANKEVLVGTFQLHMKTLVNVHGAKIEVEDKPENDKIPCLLKLTYKIREKKDFRYVFTTNTKLPLFYQTNMNCKANQTEDLVRPENQFVAWHDQLMSNHRFDKFAYENVYQIKPVMEEVDHKAVLQEFLANFTQVDNVTSLLFNMSVWNGPVTTWRTNKIVLDPQGRLHGICDFESEDEFFNQTGRHELLNWAPRYISGRFVHGRLEGMVTIHTWMSNLILATFKEGVMHGPVYSYGLSSVLDIEARGFIYAYEGRRNHHHPGNHFVGRFKNGQAFGNFWIGMLGNGYLHGEVDDKGHVTGDKIAYIYPDGETTFLGRFENRFMKKAYAVDVLKYGCDENGMFVVKQFSDPVSDQAFFYEPPTNVSFGGGAPLGVMDPYELKTVKLAPSAVAGGGEGVFAIRDIPRNRFSCMYSLFYYRFDDETAVYSQNCYDNVNKTDDYRRHCKKYSLGTSMWMARIDVPPEFDVNPLPNLGPKVNHHFRLNNSAYSEIEHPRWGEMQSVASMIDIKAGQEIHTHYGYDRGGKVGEFPADFPWYWEAKIKLEREERLEREREEAENPVQVKIKAKKAGKKKKKKPSEKK